MERTASATWWGSLKEGRGELTSGSGVLSETRYSADSRFGEERGTNPEELIGAAHAGCYSMALSNLIAERGTAPKRIDTDASVKLEESDGEYVIGRVRLKTRVEAPGMDSDVFEEVANEAKEGCPVSKLLDAPIELDATLVA